jgi:hypothetical protein
MGPWIFSREVKLQCREADYTPAFSVEAKNIGGIRPLPTCLYDVVLD